jgi:hypothetical protein
VGFEKALKSIEVNPRDEEKITAFLLLVGQERDTDARAEAYAGLAVVLAGHDPVGALTHVESAFKIAPRNSVVLRTLVGLFERRGRRDAADAVRMYIRQEAPPPPVALQVSNGKGEVPRSRSPLARRAAAPRPEVRETDLCRALLLECDASDELLLVASEFTHSSHSVVGLVHFCHYLLYSGRVGDARRAVAWVKERVERTGAKSRARERFRELLEPFATREAHAV